MSLNIKFAPQAWEDMEYWIKADKSKVKKIQKIIKSCLRTPYEGEGNPELLKENWSGWWSRRIDLEHRFVYRISEFDLEIAQCRYHYEK